MLDGMICLAGIKDEYTREIDDNALDSDVKIPVQVHPVFALGASALPAY
ncbi:hypothetical protein ACLK17_19840 [Escherichia coli]